jgi:hypothetical protein
MLLTIYPYRSNAATPAASSSLVISTPEVSAEAKARTLLLRLNEISVMDKSNLTSSEKKNLRKEIRSIRHEIRETGQGVYLSVGGIIIIVLLLILLV